LIKASPIQPVAVEWIWPDRVPLGMLTWFSGDPKLGKSLVTPSLIVAMTRGRPLPPTRADIAASRWESGAAIHHSVQLLYDITACCAVGGRAWNSLRRNPARANMAWYSANV
jgi:hypothetical protein